jgi:hypothetical protein
MMNSLRLITCTVLGFLALGVFAHQNEPPFSENDNFDRMICIANGMSANSNVTARAVCSKLAN